MFVCSFAHQEAILNALIYHTFEMVFVPTRQSRIENLFAKYRGAEVMTKAFELIKHKRG